MPFNPINQVFLQYETPIGVDSDVFSTVSGSSLSRGTVMILRGLFTTIDFGDPESSGEMNFRRRQPPNAYVEFVDVNDAVKDTWYEVAHIFDPPQGMGLWDFQIQVLHPEGNKTSNTIQFTLLPADRAEGLFVVVRQVGNLREFRTQSAWDSRVERSRKWGKEVLAIAEQRVLGEGQVMTLASARSKLRT